MEDLKTVFAQRLKTIRKKRGLTQERLAEIVNVAPRHISYIENSKSFPSSDLIERLCKNLNVNYVDFFFSDNLTKDELTDHLLAIIKRLDIKKLKILYQIASNI